MEDVTIIGSGPAGLSAAINVCARGKSALVISNAKDSSGLSKAPEVNNYLGLPDISGQEMIERFVSHGTSAGIKFRQGRVINVLPLGDEFMVTLGSEVVSSRTVILALGAIRQKTLPGEVEYLGHGVSYCATCDGMLYRDRPVVVVGGSSEALADTLFLTKLTKDVTYVAKHIEESLPSQVKRLTFSQLEVVGDGAKATGLKVDGRVIPSDCVFVLRDVIAPVNLVEGLAMEGPYIKVNRNMSTNIPGLFAAGDCTGEPRQVAKAVGEGQVAGLSACALIDEHKES